MSLGRNSLVGTTVKTAKKLPSHLLGDEKHTQWYKDKVYLATPVAEGCILGAYLVKQATESDLTLAIRPNNSKSLSSTGRLFVRAMSLVWNFHPFCKKIGRHSPFADLNELVYHNNWQNMMISASLGGRR